MKEYIFVHGKNASLSAYEIKCLFPNEIIYQQQAFSVIKTSSVVNQKFLDQCGGIIKICERFDGAPEEILLPVPGKILFAVSQYGGQKPLSEILLKIKKNLQKHGRNARFLNKKFSNVSSAQLIKSRILEKGLDLSRFFYQKKEVWGKTIAVQDINAYSFRDYERPKRDMKMGMMPPKLAQMMIHFAKSPPETTIYDPFCGLGTILMEASLQGYPILGSDINSRYGEGTFINLQWLSKHFKTTKPDQKKIFQHDATKTFFQHFFPQNLTVVTEGYLGPLLLQFPDENTQNKIFDLIHHIYIEFFSRISQIIREGNYLVICFPFFRSFKKKVFYPQTFFKQYVDLGFHLEQTPHQLLYERKDQVVGREIKIFKKL